MSDTLRITTHDGVASIEAAAWDRLVGPDQDPFLEHSILSWFDESGCTGERTGWYPLILAAWRGEEPEASELVGGAPLYVKTNSAGEFVFDWAWANAAERAGIAYYPKAVIAVPFTPAPGRRLLSRPDLAEIERRAIERALAHAAIQIAGDQGLSSLHINFVREDEARRLEALGLGVRYGMQYHWYNGQRETSAEPYRDFDAFLARFRSKKRANIRRERRLVREAGIQTRVERGPEVREEVMDRMFRYYRDTVQKFYYGRQYLTRDFFLGAPERLGDRLHLVLASQEGRDFAGAFNVHKNDRLYGRYWGCEREVQNVHFEVCMYAAIEWCIEHGVRVFEPGAGGEHKYERGFEPTHTYSAHQLFDPRLDAAVRDFLRHERAQRDHQIGALSAQNPFKN